MFRLTHDQLESIEQLLARRRARAIAEVLQETWPALPERLKERWGAFVEAAVLRGREAGLDRVEQLARYASLWCLWGASFEDKPGFDWAREIVSDPQRNAALRMHQLMHRTREELQRRVGSAPAAAAVITPTQFDAATLALDRRVASIAAAKAVFLDEPPLVPAKACDIGSVDLMVAEPENLQEYRSSDAGWRRVPAPKPATAALHGSRATELPTLLAVVSHPLRGGSAARLNLKVEPHAVCDVRVHPELVHASGQGRLAWKGRDTARLSLALYAAPPLPPEGGGPAGIAAPVAPELQQVALASCAVRDAGAPFGDVSIEIAVHPATQWLTEVRQAAWPPMSWPAAGTPPPPASVALRLEADGTVRDAAAWQRAWAGLQVQTRQGFERLFNAFARGRDAAVTRLDAEMSALVGQAGLTWGCRRIDAATVALRTEGRLELIACAADLRFATELTIDGASARLNLACQGRSELRMAVQQLGDEAAEGEGLAAVQRSWRYPFTVEVEPLVGAGIATLHALPTPPAALGAIVGEAGLRPRPDGAGLQWYFVLRSEAAAVQLGVRDPVTGDAQHVRSLLPALTLVDWSAG